MENSKIIINNYKTNLFFGTGKVKLIIIGIPSDDKVKFLTEFRMIGYSILSEIKGRKQVDLESIMSFVTNVKNVC